MNVWIQAAIKSQQWQLDEMRRLDWAVSKRTQPGDLIVMYRGCPVSCITDLFEFVGPLEERGAGWRAGSCWGGIIRHIGKLKSPLSLDELRQHPQLKHSNFVRGNMQGPNLSALRYWPVLHAVICEHNPELRKKLADWEIVSPISSYGTSN